MIRIKNIFYMLSYAYSILQKDEYKSIETEEFDNIADLFAAILCIGISYQIKKGLHREYVQRTEAVSVPIGKINISSSLSNLSIMKRQLVCSFDNLTDNTYVNQILKSTAVILIKSKEVKDENRKLLKKALLYFSNVECIALKSIKWSTIQYQRNNATYKMLINICYLILSGLLLTNSEGNSKLMNYLDDQNMYRLYEKFVLNFYKKHYPQFRPKSSYIRWNTDDNHIDFLPAMKSDIMLYNNEKTFIIDTKYYSKTLQSKYDKKSIHSSNMYQIFTYVKNQDINSSGNVTGALLYAKTQEEIQPDNEYLINGNAILIKTLDLDQDFIEIKKQLDNLIKKWLVAA